MPDRYTPTPYQEGDIHPPAINLDLNVPQDKVSFEVGLYSGLQYHVLTVSESTKISPRYFHKCTTR